MKHVSVGFREYFDPLWYARFYFTLHLLSLYWILAVRSLRSNANFMLIYLCVCRSTSATHVFHSPRLPAASQPPSRLSTLQHGSTLNNSNPRQGISPLGNTQVWFHLLQLISCNASYIVPRINFRILSIRLIQIKGFVKSKRPSSLSANSASSVLVTTTPSTTTSTTSAIKSSSTASASVPVTTTLVTTASAATGWGGVGASLRE